MEGGRATREAARNRGTPDAKHATVIKIHPHCQSVYDKPGALFSVNRLFRHRSLVRLARVFLIGRAMVWNPRTN